MDLLSFIVASAQTMAVLLISCCCRTLPRHRKGTKSSMGWKTSSAQCCTRKTAHLEKLNLKQVVPHRDVKDPWHNAPLFVDVGASLGIASQAAQ